MTRQEKLEWLARNVHEWKQGFNLCVVNPGAGETYVTWPSACIPSGSTFTKADWISMRDKLQNKPKFADHPDAKCFVQDGRGYWHKNTETHFVEPFGENWRAVDEIEITNIMTLWAEVCRGEILGDWRDTLEKRPEMPSKTNIARELEDVPKIDFSAGGKIDDRWQEWQNNHEVEELIVTIKNDTIKSVAAATKTGPNEMTITTQDNSWHERGELSPVGTSCEVKTKTFKEWIKCFVVGKSHRGDTVIECDECAFIIDSSYEFRPLRTERERAIDAACKAIGGVCEDELLVIEKLYDAGMLK